MESYKIILGYTATLVAFISFVPYFRDIFKNKTKPHAFSWFIWGLLAFIAFGIQVGEKSGAGAWVNAMDGLMCFAICILALVKGERKFVLLDWISLIGAFIGIFLWQIIDQPLLAILMVMLTDAFGFVPTFRKGYLKPFEETLFTYLLSAFKFVFALFAFDSWNLTIILYPLWLILLNSSFVLFLFVRRKAVN